ncbi:BnaC05g07850D [Brassica napus]|uniref:BnaC05g07850D protein n=1 Tax=Brassica napus TaxID=3708 RepID=A0A078HKY2_BRANA|nr:BnaC05g07850D [Brassica napus]
MGGIPLMILLMEMTMAGERRVTDGKAQGVMAEEAQIQKLKNGWRMKRDTRTPLQKKKSIEKDHQVIRRRAMHMIGCSRFSHEGDSSESILTEAGKEAMP